MAKSETKAAASPSPEANPPAMTMPTAAAAGIISKQLASYQNKLAMAIEAVTAASRDLTSAIMWAKDAGGRSNDYATIYATLYRDQAALNAATKPLSDMFGELKTVKVPEAFERDNVKTLTMADGARITISNVVRASVIGGKKEAAFDWLRSTDQADLITETLNASTLSAFAKTLMEKNESLPEELFNVVVMPSVSLTGSKAKG